jgi:uncharacterized protein
MRGSGGFTAPAAKPRAKTMTVGVLQLELSIPDSFSLKDKRRAIHSLRDRLAHGRNISVAEVGALDEHRRSVLAVAMVANDAGYVEGGLRKIVDFVATVPQVVLDDFQIDLL